MSVATYESVSLEPETEDSVGPSGPPPDLIRLYGPVPRILLFTALLYLACALALLPAAQPYDLAGLTGASDAWLRWGVPLSYDWKFGFDLSVLAVGSQGLRFLLESLGMSGAAAITAAWKLPLILSNLIAAAGLYDLSLRAKFRHPTMLSAIWLLSPVALWVAAGHGQLEPLAAASMIVASCLTLRRRWALAGLSVGLGVGVEYLPIIVAAVVALWVLSGFVSRRDGLRFGLGLLGGLVLAFGPELASGVGRRSLFSGLSSTAQATKSSVAAIPLNPSVWRLLGFNPGALWLVVLVLVAGGCAVVFVRRGKNASNLDRNRYLLALTGSVLLAVVLLDPGSLPQFAVLTLLGLCLLTLALPVSPAVVVVAPILQLSVGLFYVYGGSFESFWYDMWAKSGQPGWVFPQSVFFASAAGNVSVALVVVGVVLATLGWSHRFSPSFGPGRLGTRLSSITKLLTVARLATALGLAVCVFFSVWSLQPRFWQAIGSGGPSSLADWANETATRQANYATTAGRTTVSVPSTLAMANVDSRVHGVDTLSVQFPTLLNTQVTGVPLILSAGHRYEIKLRDWTGLASSARSVWVDVLLGSQAWNKPGNATIVRTSPAMIVGQRQIAPETVKWLVPDWGEVSYSVPASMFSREGGLSWTFSEPRVRVIWNGSRSHHWIVVGLHKASVSLVSSSASGGGTAVFPTPSLGSSPQSSGIVRLDTEASSVSFRQMRVGEVTGTLTAATVVWPEGTPLDSTISGPWLTTLGLLDVIVLLLCSAGLIVALLGGRKKSRLVGFGWRSDAA